MDRPILIYFERADIDALSTAAPASALRKMAMSALTAREYADRLQLVFEGFDLGGRPVYEHPKACQFVGDLTAKFPYWGHFCSKSDHSLWLVMQCLLRVGGTVDTREAEIPAEWGNMGALADWLCGQTSQLYSTVGMTVDEASEMTDKVRRYLRERRAEAAHPSAGRASGSEPR
jgi:hypothetical protein